MKSKSIINKFIERDARIRSYFFEFHLLNINTESFIKKINQHIEQKNLNDQTNVQGEMTDWKAFLNDEDLRKILYDCFFELKDYAKIGKVTVDEAWGIKINKGDFTFEHNHGGTMFSGVLYLSDSEQKLVFPELEIEVTPKKGTLVMFNSYLKHKTNSINKSDEPKYGIAFNCNTFTFL